MAARQNFAKTTSSSPLPASWMSSTTTPSFVPPATWRTERRVSSMNMVRKNSLRQGDAVTGAVRVPQEGDQGQSAPEVPIPLVRLDTVNGVLSRTPGSVPSSGKLTPLYPNQRLRLETTTERLTTRIIDLIMPIGRGSALIVSPPKSGQTTILQDIANAITRNNPSAI